MGKRVGLLAETLPDSFPAGSYDRLYLAMNPLRGHENHPRFNSAWKAMAYRYLAVTEHDVAFRAALTREGANRYAEEKELFEFFFCGLSAIECMCYAIHYVGSMFSDGFYTGHPREITPEKVAKRFNAEFPDEGLTLGLVLLSASTDRCDWKRLRDVLAHGEHPGRTIISGPTRQDVWNLSVRDLPDLKIDASLTRDRLLWLSDVIEMITSAAVVFVEDR